MYIKTISALVDSNGEIYRFPGVAYGDDLRAVGYENPCHTAFVPFGPQVYNTRGNYYHLGYESSAHIVAVFYNASGDLTDPISMAPGHTVNVQGASGFRVVALIRAGLMRMTVSDALSIATPDAATARFSRHVQIPVPVFLGGLSAVSQNTWTLAGDAIGPACEFSGEPYSAQWDSQPTFTSSHWQTLTLVALGRDRNGAYTNRRPIINLTNLSIIANIVHAHDELGVWAVPSASNPSPTAPPFGGMLLGLNLMVYRCYQRISPVDSNRRLV